MSWRLNLAKLRGIARRDRHADELQEEMRAHLEMEVQENLAAGMSPEEARRAAHLSFGNVTRAAESSREAWGWPSLESIGRDLRHALRLLARSPAFTATAVLTLALAICANTTIFSLVNALLLRPLPVGDPATIVALYTSDYSGPRFGASSYADYLDLSRGQSFDGVAAYTPMPVALTQPGGQAARAFVDLVSVNYFSVLGVTPQLGRGFLPQEGEAEGREPVVVISHALWRNRFAGDPHILGMKIVMNGSPFTIVGVAPPGFSGVFRGLAMDLWTPITMQGTLSHRPDKLDNRGNRGVFLLARLKPGAILERVRAEMAVLAQRLRQQYPEQWTDINRQGRVITVLPESQARIFPAARGPVAGFMALLLVVTGLVLLVACANIANLLLARAAGRRREIAVRLSLGATRRRLLRQLTTESIVLGLLAGGVGLAATFWTTRLLTGFKPPVPVPVELDLSPDARVLLFAMALSILTALTFGLVPALQATRSELSSVLKDDSGATGYFRRSLLRNGLVIAQVAISALLLVGSGLFLRSLQNASQVNLGFDPNNVITFGVDLRSQGYNDSQTKLFFTQLLDRIGKLDGADSATVAAYLPLGWGGRRSGVAIEGYKPQAHEDLEVSNNAVGPNYFSVMRTPLLRGRDFSSADAAPAPGVIIVNRSFGQRYWPGQDPLGRRITLGDKPFEVIGVVADSKNGSLGEDPTPMFYQSILQTSDNEAAVLVRGRQEARSLFPALREQVHALDRTLPLFDVKLMTEHLALALLPARLAATVLGIVGATALLLASIGLYALISYSVSQRTHEIGIRVAIGASPAQVRKLVARQGLTLTAIGLAIGLGMAAGVTRFASSLLYGIAPTDALTLAAVGVLLAGVASVAILIPAHRASSVDPMVALRTQ